MLFFTLLCTSNVCRKQRNASNAVPNNSRPGRKTSRPDLEKRRRESVAEIRRNARDEMLKADMKDDSVLFTNPLFESDSTRQHFDAEPKRPPLPLPSEMNDPSAAWPHAQGLLSSSASQPLLHSPSTDSHLNMPPVPLQRPPGPEARPRLARPPSSSPHDRPPMALPRPVPISFTPNQPSPRPRPTSAGEQRPAVLGLDLRPPDVPTTQRPTLPRVGRHDHTNLEALEPHTVPKRDSNGGDMPVAHKADLSPMTHARSTSVLERFTSEYVEPSGNWMDQHAPTSPGPHEYVIAGESNPVINALDGESYMDMVSVQNSQPPALLHGVSQNSLNEPIISAPVAIPRRVRRPSSPTSAPQFRKSSKS